MTRRWKRWCRQRARGSTLDVRTSRSPGDESPEAQVTAIRSGNSAVAEMVASVRGLGERRLERDMPTQPWLEDWKTLVTLREQYAVDLEGGGSPDVRRPPGR